MSRGLERIIIIDEGRSDSVSHLKTSLLGNSITLPISKGKLVRSAPWADTCA